jgi:hypothetical protein
MAGCIVVRPERLAAHLPRFEIRMGCRHRAGLDKGPTGLLGRKEGSVLPDVDGVAAGVKQLDRRRAFEVTGTKLGRPRR